MTTPAVVSEITCRGGRDEEKDCENEKGGDDLMVNDEDLDEMYNMYVHIQPVEGNFNNNKRKLSEEDTQTSCKKRKT